MLVVSNNLRFDESQYNFISKNEDSCCKLLVPLLFAAKTCYYRIENPERKETRNKTPRSERWRIK